MTETGPPFGSAGARPLCGGLDCVVCLDATNALLHVPARATLPGPAPTAAALERHARKYGPGQVAETAAEFGLSVAVERQVKRSGGGGPSLKTRVAGYVAEGYGAEVIAELEDISASRARRLVREAAG